MTRKFGIWAFWAAALVVAGCGGGGGGSAGNSGATPTVNITQQNAQQLAATSLDSSIVVYDSAGAADGVTSKASAVSGSTRRFSLTGFTRMMLDEVTSQQGGDFSGKAAAKTGVCTTGTVDVTHNDLNGDGQPSAGDGFTAAFTSCDVEGTVMNGSMSITINSFSQSSGSMSASISMNNLTASESGDTISMNGSYSFTMTITASPLTMNLSISCSSLTVAVNSTSTTLSGFSLTASANAATFTMSMSGTIESAALGGTVTFSTPSPLTASTMSGDGTPTGGTFKVTGAGGTSVTVSIGGSAVNVAADTNGDGTSDWSTNTTWDALTTSV
jgi:hypothetical protein